VALLGSSDAEACNANATTEQRVPSEGENNTQAVFSFLASQPQLTRVQAAAIVGNLIHESGGDADLAVFTNNPNQSSGATGIAHWLGGRLDNLKRHKPKDPALRKLPWTDIRFQIDFLWWELTRDPASTFNALDAIKRTSNISDAAKQFEQTFERSGVTASYPQRIQNARDVLEKYGDDVAADEVSMGVCTSDGDLPTEGGDRSVAAVKRAADELDKMRLPYNYGAGHITPAKPSGGQQGSYLGLDCSSSVSWVLQHAGFKVDTMVSGAYMTWGDPGPGKYVTLYANEAHIFMKIGKRYFGTSGFGHPNAGTGPAWFTKPVSSGYTDGFTQVHPHGL
jgi:hypothetical protein